MNNPRVTVLMPVYNGEKYLREAMESIIDQTFRDFEFLIINDGSTDQSVQIIRSYNDQRIRLVENETNLGLISTLNKGIDLARGEYIARMDADDIFCGRYICTPIHSGKSAQYCHGGNGVQNSLRCLQSGWPA